MPELYPPSWRQNLRIFSLSMYLFIHKNDKQDKNTVAVQSFNMNMSYTLISLLVNENFIRDPS